MTDGTGGAYSRKESNPLNSPRKKLNGLGRLGVLAAGKRNTEREEIGCIDTRVHTLQSFQAAKQEQSAAQQDNR
jgi:hypothetical protein